MHALVIHVYEPKIIVISSLVCTSDIDHSAFTLMLKKMGELHDEVHCKQL